MTSRPPPPLRRVFLGVQHEQALRALFEQQLSKGRAFVPCAAGMDPLQACVLVVEHAGRQHELAAEVVFVKEEGLGCGVGLQLASLDAEQAAALRAFVEGNPSDPEPRPSARDEVGEPDLGSDGPARPASVPPTLQARIRELSLTEQQRMAASGNLSERIALERAFGPNVWETLLANPRLTPPEVARMARKGTLPKSLLESIAAHASWLGVAEVQRALLGNPRTSAPIIGQVLAVMSRADLMLVPAQTAYPQAVRAYARRLLGLK